MYPYFITSLSKLMEKTTITKHNAIKNVHNITICKNDVKSMSNITLQTHFATVLQGMRNCCR
jgi:hypothetical protein